MTPELIAYTYIVSPQYMQELYPQDERNWGLVADVKESAGCLKIGQGLYKSCGTKVRPRYSGFGVESRRAYIRYLKKLANTNIEFAKRSPLLEDYCDISQERHIDNARKKIIERANIILDYANNY